MRIATWGTLASMLCMLIMPAFAADEWTAYRVGTSTDYLTQGNHGSSGARTGQRFTFYARSTSSMAPVDGRGTGFDKSAANHDVGMAQRDVGMGRSGAGPAYVVYYVDPNPPLPTGNYSRALNRR